MSRSKVAVVRVRPDHIHKRMIQDKAEQPGRLTGMIQTYDNQKSDLFTLQFKGAEICGVTIDKSESSSEEIKQVKIDVQTESMEFSYAAMEVI